MGGTTVVEPAAGSPSLRESVHPIGTARLTVATATRPARTRELRTKERGGAP